MKNQHKIQINNMQESFIEFFNSIISSHADSIYYYEISIGIAVVFVSFVFMAPLLELQEFFAGALVNTTRIEIGIEVQIRMWSMDGPIPLDTFRRPLASMFAKMLWCNRCKRHRDRLGNAFGKRVLRLYENDRVSKRFECVVLDDDDEEYNEELNIFICPTNISDFRSIQERVRLECRVLKGSSVYGRVKLEIESPTLKSNRRSYSFLEPILISVHANLGMSDIRDDLQILLCPEKELRKTFTTTQGMCENLARAHAKPIRCKEDDRNDRCEMTFVVKDRTLAMLKTGRYVAVLTRTKSTKLHCLCVSNTFDITAPSLEIVTTMDSKSSATTTIQSLRWHEPFAVRVSCPGYHQSEKKDYIAICPRGHQGLPCVPSPKSFLKRGLEFVGLSSENISNSHFVHDNDDDDSSASLSTEKNTTTKLVHFSMPWLLPGAYHAVYCVWIPAVKKYHSSVWRSAPFQILGPTLDLMISSETNRVATLRGKLLCSDPVVANVSNVSGRMHSGYDSVALCYLPTSSVRKPQSSPSAPCEVVEEEKKEKKDLSSKALQKGDDLEIVRVVFERENYTDFTFFVFMSLKL